MQGRVSSSSSSAGKKDSSISSPGTKTSYSVHPQSPQKNGSVPRPGGCGCGKRKRKS